MKRIALIISIALVGIGLVAFPMVSNYLFATHASTATQQYDDTIRDTDAEKIQQMLAEATVYNENLEGNPAHDPFLQGSGMAMADNYASVLRMDNKGTMGYITIPQIGVKLSIFHSTTDSVLESGVGHLEGSSLPIGGAGTHAVLTGHTGLAHAKMFTDLRELKQGAVFYLHVLGQTLAYEVDQIKVVEPEITEDLRKIPDQDYCTLITCTPYGVNSHRLLVRGTRIEYNPEVEQQLMNDSPQTFQWFTQWNLVIGAATGTVVAIVIVLLLLKRKKKETKGGQEPWDSQTQSIPANTGGTNKKRKKVPTKYWWEEENG
ncbi:MAG: class C sortase [Oscillospiraceae bacterium]|jgi:sortase A|nr:class C sortase [Oscillospiraceae bacterium]